MYFTIFRGQFKEVLLRLRDGIITTVDWEYINSHDETKNVDPVLKILFETSHRTFLYCTNEECNKNYRDNCRITATYISGRRRSRF